MIGCSFSVFDQVEKLLGKKKWFRHRFFFSIEKGTLPTLKAYSIIDNTTKVSKIQTSYWLGPPPRLILVLSGNPLNMALKRSLKSDFIRKTPMVCYIKAPTSNSRLPPLRSSGAVNLKRIKLVDV